MKMLSPPEGDALLTNAEVMNWIRDGKLAAPKGEGVADGEIDPPENAREIAKDLLEYFERSPSGNQTVKSVEKLFEKLKKFKLSSPELLMIANIRPEFYAHITPLIVDIHNRFDEDQVYEMLEAVKTTLEPRPQREQSEEEEEVLDGTLMAKAEAVDGTALLSIYKMGADE